MNIMHIHQLRVGVLQDDGTARDLSIKESPLYLSLERNDAETFDKYRKVVMSVSGAPDDEMTWEAFRKLSISIWQNGFVVQEPRIRFNGEGVCLDGHHRLSVLYYRFGERMSLEIINQEVHSVWVKSSR